MTNSAIPKGLGPRGRAFWRSTSDEFDLGGSDLVLLEQACSQLDAIADLESLLKEQGPMVVGSTGQLRLNPIVGELRQGRIALVKLVDALSWPADDGVEGVSPASRKAKKAADHRWGRVRLLEERRAGGVPDAS